jgi:hypothetical protein
MPNFTWSICEPDNPEIVEMGTVSKEDIAGIFENYPWVEKLNRTVALGDKAFYSPSLRFGNADNKYSIEISIVGSPESYEYYIFYTRPKEVSTFLGMRKKKVDAYLSDITGQTTSDAGKLLTAFITEEYALLETRF